MAGQPSRLLGLILLVAGCGPSSKPEDLSLNDLSLEVSALRTFFDFQLTADQLQTLRKLAPETMDDTKARQVVKPSPGFRKCLLRLHAALVSGDNDEDIANIEEEVEELRLKEKVELDDGIEITEAAAQKRPQVVRLLSARQVVFFVSGFGNEFPDPVEMLHDALHGVRKLNAEEWKEFRETLPLEVGRLVAGLDAEKAARIADKIVQLLIQARSLKEDELKTELPELEESARKIVGEVNAFDVIRNTLENAMAELLSNPRLLAAVDARLKRP